MRISRLALGVAILFLVLAGCSSEEPPAPKAEAKTVTVIDAMNRTLTLPATVERVICSGPGCLRYLTYLQAQNRAVAVDSIELRENFMDARPYSMTNPQFKTLPLFGQFRGHDNPELIAGLDPQPQVIFKTNGTMGHDPEELQAKTGIPVVVLDYGDLGVRRAPMDAALRSMGTVLGLSGRAEEVIAFFDRTIADLRARADSVPVTDRPSCFVGGIAFKGPHGFQSTEPGYPPFLFLNALNLAAPTDGSKPVTHADVAKEQLVQWDPDVLFIDLSSIRGGTEANALYELAEDAAYRDLSALKKGRVYGVLPYNSYTSNHGSTLADAYFIGKVLYPDAFKDVVAATKSDEIFTFLVGKPVFAELDAMFGGLVFRQLDPQTIRIDEKAQVIKE